MLKNIFYKSRAWMALASFVARSRARASQIMILRTKWWIAHRASPGPLGMNGEFCPPDCAARLAFRTRCGALSDAPQSRDTRPDAEKRNPGSAAHGSCGCVRGTRAARVGQEAVNDCAGIDVRTTTERGNRQLPCPHLLRSTRHAGSCGPPARMDRRAFPGPARQLA